MDDKLKQAITELKKKYGEGCIATASEAVALTVRRQPTGIMALDAELGGGFATGRIHILYGAESSGKSVVTLKTIAQAQADTGKPAALIMTEEWDPVWAAACGVDLDKLELVYLREEEMALQALGDFVATRMFCVVGLDSASNLQPSKELDVDMEDYEDVQKQMGLRARILGDSLRRVTKSLAPLDIRDAESINDTLVLITHQGMFEMRKGGNPNLPPKLTVPMGRVQRFLASTMVEMTRIARVSDSGAEGGGFGEKIVGVRLGFRTYKNKTFDQYREGSFIVFYADASGFRRGEVDNVEAVLMYAHKLGVVQQQGAWFVYEDQKFHGVEKVNEYIMSNPEVFSAIQEAVALRIAGIPDVGELPASEEGEEANATEAPAADGEPAERTERVVQTGKQPGRGKKGK